MIKEGPAVALPMTVRIDGKRIGRDREKQQGKRTDLTSGQTDQKSDRDADQTSERIANRAGDRDRAPILRITSVYT